MAQLYVPALHGHLLRSIVEIHIDCILHDHMIAKFLPPLDEEKIHAWWQKQVTEVEDKQRLMFVTTTEDGLQATGVIMLALGGMTSPHLGEIEKLMVARNCRNQGLAKMLLLRMEEEALQQGRTCIMLGTPGGSAAESIYPKLGYITYGTLPDCVISPLDRKPRSLVWMYKHLAGHNTADS